MEACGVGGGVATQDRLGKVRGGTKAQPGQQVE